MGGLLFSEDGEITCICFVSDFESVISNLSVFGILFERGERGEGGILGVSGMAIGLEGERAAFLRRVFEAIRVNLNPATVVFERVKIPSRPLDGRVISLGKSGENSTGVSGKVCSIFWKS